MVDRETLVEAAVATLGVVVLVAAVVAAGVISGSEVTGSGGLVMVGGILLFVLFMAVSGFWLASR